MICADDIETIFPRKLLLSNITLHDTFLIYYLVGIKLLKVQIWKILQSGGPLTRTGLTLVKNVLTHLAKSFL